MGQIMPWINGLNSGFVAYFYPSQLSLIFFIRKINN